MLVLLDPALGEAACAAAAAFVGTPLHALYLALVFTRTAAMRLPPQRPALLVTAFAKGVEQVLRRRGGGLMSEPRISRQPSAFAIDTCSEDIRIALAVLRSLSHVGLDAREASAKLVWGDGWSVMLARTSVRDTSS